MTTLFIKSVRYVTLAVGCGLALLACSGGDSESERPQGSAGTPGTDASADVTELDSPADVRPDTGESGPGEDVGVPDAGPDADAGPPFTVRLWHGDWLTKAPVDAVVGATVALDDGAGHRVEVTSDAAGTVTFFGVDWAAGAASLTVDAEDAVLLSVIGVTEADDGMSLTLESTRPPPFVVFSGEAAGVDAPPHKLTVSSNLSDSHLDVASSTYWLQGVVADRPGAIVGVEWTGTTACPPGSSISQDLIAYAMAEFPASSAPLTVNLDFDNPLPTETVTGRIQLVEDPDSRFRKSATVYYWVKSVQGAMYHGFPACTTRVADGTAFTFEGKHALLPSGYPVETRYVIRGGERASYVTLEGAPHDGIVVDGFLDELRMVSPAEGATHPVGEPIEWVPPPGAEYAEMRLYRDKTLWRVRVYGTTSVTLPALPSSVDASEFWGGANIVARISPVADEGKRYSTTGYFLLSEE